MKNSIQWKLRRNLSRRNHLSMTEENTVAEVVDYSYSHSLKSIQVLPTVHPVALRNWSPQLFLHTTYLYLHPHFSHPLVKVNMCLHMFFSEPGELRCWLAVVANQAETIERLRRLENLIEQSINICQDPSMRKTSPSSVCMIFLLLDDFF